MTEVERIIESKILRDNFFEEEVICDFLVSSKMKKIWAVEIDLLLELDRVCKKHNLKYTLSGGSLLGAIRHKGFIPWDDDVDVTMMREDYDILMEIGKYEFKHPYFLQTPYTDSESYFSFANLRNTNTSGIIYPFRYQKYNHGINIDIFALDNCIMEDVEERYNKINELIMDNSAYMRKSNPHPNKEDIMRIQKHSGRNPMDVYEEMVSIATQYKHEDTDFVNISLGTSYAYDKLMYRKSAFNNIIYREFEGVKLPIPEEYDYILKVQYGDYMQLPPVSERGQWHSKMVFEPDIPYKDFIETIR